MTNSTRRYAAAVAAAFAPLAVVSVITAAPSSAECTEGQTTFNGNCVDSNCKKSEVRDGTTGECRNALSAALGKAQAPMSAQVTPEQWGQAYQIGQQYAGLPSGVQATKDVFSVVNSAIDVPTSVASGLSDTADALYFAGQFLGGAGGASARSAAAPFNAMGAIADAAQALPSPKIGLPKVGLPKVGLPKIGMPKLFQNCLPVKFVFFRPCI
ncbi:putative uncharacterized protein [Mycolicibacterium canariasense]|uniref:Uncharacterized protein n=1 Tax=Mycolicibacterium canariasense TaxID=228230 RepID=A0A100WA33_MYCCR|nr:hypothetical protein [Mycolicibacterium canariasense]MCV7208893.1 hypothetical protein [Mycolicibacterium canariasense]ORV07048.1 hypothetical protein AWB94_13645 [Mycolicibacterium canariasense]GAS94315.1 putative uncharacterized protein [Mycolicibacterium canariasense]